MHQETVQGVQATARVIEHSVNHDTGKPLVTFLLSYPRFIHGEFMTHRVFSRNASSSRAIPVNKMIATIQEDPAFFVHVGKNQPGMQAREEVDAETNEKFRKEWNELLAIASEYSLRWANDYGIHKQCANRVVEPWMRMKVVVTASEWDNFYELRDHEDAQPEIQDLARTMKRAIEKSQPRYVRTNEMEDARCWHLPFVTMQERKAHPVVDLIRASTARCARTSFNNHDNTQPDIQKDIELHDRLVVAQPIHASPAEHQACATDMKLNSGNLSGGWAQYRKLLERHGPDLLFNALSGKIKFGMSTAVTGTGK